jgi:hypothetical protein
MRVIPIADEHAVLVERCDEAFLDLPAGVTVAGINHQATNIILGWFHHLESLLWLR